LTFLPSKDETSPGKVAEGTARSPPNAKKISGSEAPDPPGLDPLDAIGGGALFVTTTE
jgi:hypothetical protein